MARFVINILAALMLVQFALAQAPNYCYPALCTDFKGVVYDHIACKQPPRDKQCLKPVTLTLTQDQKNLFVSTHNELRNGIALGKEPRYGKCDRMTTVIWDEVLAGFAAINTQSCSLVHDQCHNTETYRYSGQNIAFEGSMPDAPEVNAAIVGAVKGWYAEHPFADPSDILKFSRGKNLALNQDIGHFTQVVNAKSFAIGCGMTQYEDSEGWKKVLTTCNYATPNMIGFPIYVVGETAARCKTGTNPTYPGLCSVNEVVDPNAYWLS